MVKSCKIYRRKFSKFFVLRLSSSGYQATCKGTPIISTVGPVAEIKMRKSGSKRYAEPPSILLPEVGVR